MRAERLVENDRRHERLVGKDLGIELFEKDRARAGMTAKREGMHRGEPCRVDRQNRIVAALAEDLGIRLVMNDGKITVKKFPEPLAATTGKLVEDEGGLACRDCLLRYHDNDRIPSRSSSPLI